MYEKSEFPLMKDIRHRVGLRWRFMLYMILLIVALMAGVFIIVEHTSRETILSEGRKRGISNALYLAALSTSSLLMYDYPKLEQNVDEVAREADIIYAMIIDREGTVVAHSERDDLIGKSLTDTHSINATLAVSGLIQNRRNPDTGEEIWDISYPIRDHNESIWGTARIGFSKELLTAEINRNRKNLAILTFVAIVLALTAAFLLAKRITGPLRKLTEGALSISRGNLNQRISIHTGDEIEDLSDTFNRMIQELSKTKERLKNLIRQLSRKNRLLRREMTTREKLEEELIKAERLRALGEMSGGVAHDFNNILGTVLGRAQLLIEKTGDPGHLKGLKIIEKAALDGAETVRRIQEFTRVRADSSTFVHVDLNDIIEDAVEFTRTRWKNEAEAWGRHIDVFCDLKGSGGTQGDPAGLREVFTNLIINAVDAMPECGKIVISTFDENGKIVAEVADTGEGMSSEVRKKLFEPFFTTKGSHGNGLGLSICYGIVSRHGGCIEVESTEGRGTTFTIRLPIIHAEQTDIQAPVTNRVLPSTVLIIDDDDNMREVLSDTLVQSGCSVDQSASGEGGLDLFGTQQYDIVMTDLGMKDMSGWDVARIVKEKSPETPVVMLTGWGAQIDEKTAGKRGIDFIMAKPFKIDKIRELVNKAMELRRELKTPGGRGER